MRVFSKLVLTIIFGGLLLGAGSILLIPAFSNLSLFSEPGTLSTPVSGSVSSDSVAVCHFGSISIAGRRFFAFLLRFLPIS